MLSSTALTACVLLASPGCSLVPDIKHKPQLINPFPQLRTVAVLPFSNQSEEPTLSGERVTLAYMNEIQEIRGFDVLPLGAIKIKLAEFRRPLAKGEDFQAFAAFLGVDAVLVGSVTDYDPYYPPRMTMKVNWYAANPGFHPVHPGYGLPWGTKDEKKIPRWIHHESQRALAVEQLKTQTPDIQTPDMPTPELRTPELQTPELQTPRPIMPEDREMLPVPPLEIPSPAGELELDDTSDESPDMDDVELLHEPSDVTTASATILERGNWGDEWGDDSGDAGRSLPPDWPDPRGFIPDSPTADRPEYVPQYEPIISHMRSFNGHDEDFTEQLAEYFYYRDDARFGGWQAYLQRSEDFIRFCCYLHLSETLVSRGGQDKSRLILRWPIDRYTR